MSTPLLFTPELMSNVTRTESQYYSSYFQYLIQEANLEPIRQQLEDDLKVYPIDRLEKTINEIKSPRKEQSLAAISEVQAYRCLKNNFSTIEIEKPLELVENKTPDFWVDNSIAFEAFATFDEYPSQLQTIVNAINQIKSHIKVFITLDNIPKENVKINEIKQYFQSLFNSNPTPKPQHTFINKFSNGLIISGHMLALSNNSTVDTVITVIEKYNFNDNKRDYIKSIRSRIEDKLSKYKALAKSGFPIIIILYNKNHWVQREDVDKALFGDPQYEIINNKSVIAGHRNGIIRQDKNGALSAVLVKQDDINTPFRLIENPYAKVPLTDELKTKIRSAFEVV